MDIQQLLPVLIGGLVIAAVVLVFLAVGRKGEGRASERLDELVGRNVRKDSSSDLLLKQALQEVDRKNFLDRITPEVFHFTKMFEQADVNIKPSALFGVAIALAALGGIGSWWAVNMYVAPIGAVLCFSLPWLWLYAKRAGRLKKFAGQLSDALELVARALRAGHSLAAGKIGRASCRERV